MEVGLNVTVASERKKGGFYVRSSIHHWLPWKKCVKVTPPKAYRCCRWLLVTQDQWPGTPADRSPHLSPEAHTNTFHMLEDIWETGVSSMCARKAKGSRSVTCFIQVRFTHLFQHIAGANAGGPFKFPVQRGRGTCEMLDAALRALCCMWRNLGLPDAMRIHVLVVWVAQSPKCPAEDMHPSARASLCWHLAPSPAHCPFGTGSPPVLPRNRANILLEVQQSPFWNTVLKKSAIPLEENFVSNSCSPSASKVERYCLSHSLREKEILGGSCCLCCQQKRSRRER